MSFEAWYTVGTVVMVLVLMAGTPISVDVAMMGGLTILLLGDAVFGGILDLSSGLEGFAHPAVIMIGSLFVVAAGLQETGGMEVIAHRLLGRPRSVTGAQLRMMVPVAVTSGFMNNTPVVAMYIPIINDWSRKLRISASKLYMPLSFAAILGGKITLIGTASNIVVMELYVAVFSDPQQAASLEGIASLPSSSTQFWGVALLGVPTAIGGIAVILLLSRWLLPERRPAIQTVVDSRKYQLEMVVQDDAPIIGKSIEEAGLRHLPGLYLTQIERGDVVLSAVAPQERLKASDRLAFTGILESVVDLRKIRGLAPATDQVKKVSVGLRPRTLVEAVVARNSSLVGQTVRGVGFRTRYNAAIIAVHRNGEHVRAKIGDITLQPGDTLLLDTHAGFVSAYRNSDDFYLVSQVEGSRPILHERAWTALSILAVMIACITLTPLPPPVAALLGAALMVGTRCVSGTVARTSVNWQVLIVIGAALGLGASLKETNAAEAISRSLLDVCAGFPAWSVLLVTFLLTTAFAQLITSTGAAVLMFPIVMAAAHDLGVSPEPFVFSLMIAAGSTFVSPVSYQTNLMVYGPGGYRFLDYARLGVPVTLIVALITTAVAPLAFPF